mgnify:CR=1 FL=1|tara:strand:- start:1605 stop:1850 length:246 start_codon:yes stop_codon:yes gene_type:complete
MSLEVSRYIEEALNKNKNLFNAEVINFPDDKKLNQTSNLEPKKNSIWSITDKSNDDQLKAVVGVCFMFTSLIVMGLYSSLT